jgi:homoserine kinase
MEKVKIFAPNSVANVGCGYDVLGFALESYGDELIIEKRKDSQVLIKNIEGADLPYNPESNVACIAANALLESLDEKTGFDISIKKSIPPGSGLGSSASSSVGAVFGVNELLNQPFSKYELVAFAMEGERFASKQAHADNVAPSLLGGFTAVRSVEPLDVFTIPFPKELLAVIIYPEVVVNTAEAKKMLPKQVNLTDAVGQWGNMAGLVSGLMSSNFERISNSLSDLIVEPIRSKLIPHYDELKTKALESGALGFNISGSGPSTFALANNVESAQKIKQVCEEVYGQNNIKALSFISPINSKGTYVI